MPSAVSSFLACALRPGTPSNPGDRRIPLEEVLRYPLVLCHPDVIARPLAGRSPMLTT
jgi:hypothetical protein